MKSIFLPVAALLAAASFAGVAVAGEPKPVAPGPVVMGDAIQSNPAELARFKADIRKLYDMKERAFAQGDAASIVNRFYSKDAVSVGPDGKPTIGRDAFMEEYKKIVAKYNVKVESVRTYVKGDNGYDWANFYVTSKDGSEKPFSFVILFLWSKVQGRWVSPGDAYVLGQFAKESAH